ncbi:MAG: hypothetical protein NTY19_42200 [Planctomycetota bacterium]|nr:hypothetical protein [Planctomycetota bacterium]
MPSQLVTTIVCPTCAAQLPAAVEHCIQCGAATAAPRAAIEGAPPRRAAQRRWLDSRWFILVMLFGAAAVFGLPLLWSSRSFSWSAKIVWTILVVLYTGLLLWLTWLILSYCYASIRRELGGVW